VIFVVVNGQIPVQEARATATICSKHRMTAHVGAHTVLPPIFFTVNSLEDELAFLDELVKDTFFTAHDLGFVNFR
jgi:hypothetical protein